MKTLNLLFLLISIFTYIDANEPCNGTFEGQCKLNIHPVSLKPTGKITCQINSLPNISILADNVFNINGDPKTYWGTGQSVCDVLGWIDDGAKNIHKLKGMDVVIDENLTLDIEHLPKSPGGKTNGFLITLDADEFQINNSSIPNFAQRADGNRHAFHMKHIVVHEFYHFVENIIKRDDFYDDVLWVSEGSARMFEDIVYDNENPYLNPGYSPMYKSPYIADILLNSIYHGGHYKTFAFWKMMQENCILDMEQILIWNDPYYANKQRIKKCNSFTMLCMG